MKLTTHWLILSMFFAPLAAQTENLKVGDRAPDFELLDHQGNTVRLSSFQGEKNVVLAFYVLAFTGG